MRIAMLAPFAVHPKGTTRWRVLPLARALAALGHQVRVVIPPYDWPDHNGRRWQTGGVDVINVALPGQMTSLAYAHLARSVLAAALDWQPVVVHCFKPTGPSGLAAWLLTMSPAAPPLVLDADDWEAGWLDTSTYPRHWRWFFRWQEHWGLRHAGAVTAASQWLVRLAVEWRRGAGGVFYLPNGSELAGLSAAGHGGTGRTLLYTRFVEHSPEMVWDVWRRVLDREAGARLLVAGQGQRGEERRLQELAERHGAAGSVQYLGWVPAATRPGLLAAVDLALLPVAATPLNWAKSPMRLVELLTTGVPVVTQAVGEYAVYVRHGETGLVCSPGDCAALAGAVVRLLQDGQLRERLAATAVRHMRERYTWSRLLGVALAAYQFAGGRLMQS